MKQIFGIHKINGLPDMSPARDIYNIPLIENLPNSLSQINTQQTSRTSSVYITSNISGAKIFIDDIEQTGFDTPAMITDIPSGHHNFKLSSPGYIDVESSTPLEPGSTYNMFLTMGKSSSTSIFSNSSDLIIILAIGILGYLLIKSK